MFAAFIVSGALALGATAFGAFAKFQSEHKTGEYDRAGYPKREYGPTRTPNKIAFGTAGVLALAALGFGAGATVYTQGVGEASVIINAGGTVASQDATPGFSVKAPWQSRVGFDLFSQTATYAGDKDGAPSYTGGQVNGQEVTSSVAGGAQVNFDLSVTYSIDGNQVEQLYRDFRSQERFTKQVIEPQILAVVRDVPTSYKPVEFRGEKRGEATLRMTDALNAALNEYGVTVSLVSLQNIRFTEEVEASIKAVEVAQQREAEAEANLRAAEVDAQQKVVAAQAEAEANRLLSESLTPEVLEQRRIEAMKAGTVFVVPEGSQPLITTQQSGQ